MIEMQPMPYAISSLIPLISQQTMDFHYYKHYKTYIDKTNALIKGTKLENASLKEIVFDSATTHNETLFNNAAQALNHEFFFRSLTDSDTQKQVPADLLSFIERDFSSMENLLDELIKKGVSQFASGWVWLILKNQKLFVKSTMNAQTPVIEEGVKPLLCIDVWEHAYYLDYQNRRADYLEGVVKKALNWQFATQNLKA